MKPELKADVDLASTRGQAVQGHTPEFVSKSEMRRIATQAPAAMAEICSSLRDERDRLLAVNKTLVEALERMTTFCESINVARWHGDSIEQARAALKAGKG